MEYNSFYGGRRGASFIIVKSFKTIAEMVTAFSKGNQYTAVNYDEFVIIDTENKNDTDNGKIYRRGYNYTGDLGGAEYVGQIVGPAGLGPHAEMLEKSEVHQKYLDASTSGDQLDYRHGVGTLDIATGDLVPGAKGSTNNRTFDDTTDKIHWEYFSLRDDQQIESTCYIGLQIPYTVFDFKTSSISPYNAAGNYTDMTSIARYSEAEEHPFYEKWHIYIPRGIKGDTLQNFRLYTPTAAETLLDAEGISHSLAANKTVLVYDYINYDSKKDGELTTVYLGEYDVIDDVNVSSDGTITVSYKSNTANTVLSKRIKWIDSVSLTQEGVFTVNYNNGSAPYTTTLSWVEKVLLAEDGTVTLRYNTGTTEDLTQKIKWVDTVALADDGKLTIAYNNSDTPQLLNTIKWITGSSYNANTGKLIFTYNTGATEQYDYKYIASVSLSDAGQFLVKDSTGATLCSKTIEYPTSVELVDGHILTIKANTGNYLLQQDLQWVEDITIEGDNFKAIYNDGSSKVLDELLLNQINRLAIPTSGSHMFHLLILYTATEKQGAITWDGITGWTDLGPIKDYNGILIGTNIDSSSDTTLDIEANAIAYLNNLYPNGITEGYSIGKVVTVGGADSDKKFYAYDYDNGGWFYLGTTSGAADISSVILGEDNTATEQKALTLPTGSLWFVVEGDE